MKVSVCVEVSVCKCVEVLVGVWYGEVCGCVCVYGCVCGGVGWGVCLCGCPEVVVCVEVWVWVGGWVCMSVWVDVWR